MIYLKNVTIIAKSFKNPDFEILNQIQWIIVYNGTFLNHNGYTPKNYA